MSRKKGFGVNKILSPQNLRPIDTLNTYITPKTYHGRLRTYQTYEGKYLVSALFKENIN